jgi:hypothetical protein
MKDWKSYVIFCLLFVFICSYAGTALSISYSKSTNVDGMYSSSIGGSSTSLGNSLSIQSSAVTSGSGSASTNTVGNESGSFSVDDPPSSDPDFGDLRIVSSPEGAEVTLNGFIQPELTPTLITLLNPGAYGVTISLEGFEPINQNFEVVKGKEKTIIADFDGNYTPEGEEEPVIMEEDSSSEGVWSL